jgi:DNA polymerase-3 subunit delta
MPNAQLNREIERKFPWPVYFIWSEERLFLDETLAKALDAVIDPGQRDFNCDTFDPSSKPQDILDAAFSFPFMSPRRVVILKDFHQISSSNLKTLKTYFQKPSETTCMIILSSKEPKKSLRFDWRVYHLNVHEKDIPSWIEQRALSRGIKISGSAIDLLIESLGTDIGLLASEIEKLSLSGLETIEDKDIISSTGMMREFTSFNLIDAITAGEKAKAFRILRSLSEKKSYDATSVLGPLNWHYRQFFKLWENKGEKPSNMRYPTYRALVRHLPSCTEEHFRRIFQCLHETDIRIKTSGRPELALEILLIDLLRIWTRN